MSKTSISKFLAFSVNLLKSYTGWTLLYRLIFVRKISRNAPARFSSLILIANRRLFSHNIPIDRAWKAEQNQLFRWSIACTAQVLFSKYYARLPVFFVKKVANFGSISTLTQSPERVPRWFSYILCDCSSSTKWLKNLRKKSYPLGLKMASNSDFQVDFTRELVQAIFRPLLFIRNFYPARIRALSWIEWHAWFLWKTKKNFRPIQIPRGGTAISKKTFFHKIVWWWFSLIGHRMLIATM